MAIVKIQFRRDTTINWITENPILASGEPAYDTELKTFKIGDGSTNYISLPNALGGASGDGVISGSSQLDGSTFTNIIASGSFSGSYVGDGSGLSGVTSYTDADTLDFINSQQVLSGSYQVTGSTAVHVQAVSAETWSFNHNLGQEWPPIQVYDENRYVLIPSNIKSVDENNTEIHFSPAQAGYASATVGGEPMGNEIVEHLQLTASVSWSVNHNLGKLNPIITVYDGSGEVAQPFRIQPIDENNLNVLWTTPESGSVSLGGKLVSFNPVSVSGSSVLLDTTNFGNNISSSDDTVQKAMETINSLALGISGNGIISGSSQLDGTTINNLTGSFSGSFQGNGSNLTGVGNVTKVGTPVNDQIAVWTGNGTIEGNNTLTHYTSSAISYLTLGYPDISNGSIWIYGDAGNSGGEVRFYNGVTGDLPDSYYRIRANGGYFKMNGSSTGEILWYTSADQNLNIKTPTVQMDSYGGGIITGSATYGLGVDVSGNIIETSLPTVSKVGTPAANQIGVWTGDGTIKGDPYLRTTSNGYYLLGADNNSAGQLIIYGNASTAGGVLDLHTGGLNDDDDQYYRLNGGNGVYSIGGISTGNFLTYTSATQVVDLPKTTTIANTIASGSFSGSFQGDGSGLTGVGGGMTIVSKTTNESKANDATLSADSELKFNIDANGVYIAKMFCKIDGDANYDFNYGFSFPSGCDLKYTNGIWAASSSANVSGISATNISCFGVNNFRTIYVIIWIVNGANAGEVSFDWAQNVSGSVASTVYAGSILEYIKVN